MIFVYICMFNEKNGLDSWGSENGGIMSMKRTMMLVSGMFGKWAGGYEGSSSMPDKWGVDEFFGYIRQFQAHLNYPIFLNRYSQSNQNRIFDR